MTYRIPATAVLTDDALHSYALLAAHLLEYASNGANGRGETDPVYVHGITEGRDSGKKRDSYSSCGDVPHWMLFALGVRLEFVNRDQHRGWTYGTEANANRNNISTLTSLTYRDDRGRPVVHNPLAEKWAGERWGPGDVMTIWNDGSANTHAVCVIDTLDTGDLITVEGGQPGVQLFRRAIRNGRLCVVEKDGSVRLGRKIQFRLPLAKVLRAAHAGGLLSAADDPTRDAEGRPTWRLG